MSLFSEYSDVFNLLKEKQQVVFYSESRHYYQYFERLIEDLLEKDIKICYITSDVADPLLKTENENMKVIRVKLLLGFLFSKIKADVMIMTMPDLGNYIFKKSATVDTYIYMFHAAVSTHQQYQKEAFYNYDTILCTGEYQQREIRKAEEIYGLKPKELISYGYPLLDKIKKHTEISIIKQPTILIAPSWFEGCIFDTCIEELLLHLSILKYNVILRSHPEFEKRKKKKFKKIRKMVETFPGMQIDNLPNVLDRFLTINILITDRSGIAMEFAFGRQKPVLFIDSSLKINNPDYKELGIEPIENTLRNELGVSLFPSELNQLDFKLKELEKMSVNFKQKIEQLSQQTLYNSEEAFKHGLNYVLNKIKKS